MPRNVIAQQCNSLKTHPHAKKVETVGNRLIRLNYAPENCLEQFYRLKIQLPINYPEDPPSVKFDDPPDHMNICPQTGLVYQPLLMQQWSPYLSLYIIIDLLDTLMVHPQTDPKYCVNKCSVSISQIEKKSKRKTSDQLSNITNQVNRGLMRTFSRANYQSPIQPDLVEDQAPLLSSNRRALKRLRSFQCERPSQYKKLEDKPIVIKEEKKGNRPQEPQLLIESNHLPEKEVEKKIEKFIKLNNLSDIFEDAAQQNSKIISQLGDSERNPRISIYRPKPLEIQKIDISSYNDIQATNTTKELQIQHETQKRIRKKSDHLCQMPTLKRMNTIDEEKKEEHVSSRTIATPTLTHRPEPAPLKNTVFFDNSSHHLDHVNRLIKIFTQELDKLEERKKLTTNKKLLAIIQNKIQQQIAMIEDLEQLGYQVRLEMVNKVKIARKEF